MLYLAAWKLLSLAGLGIPHSTHDHFCNEQQLLVWWSAGWMGWVNCRWKTTTGFSLGDWALDSTISFVPTNCTQIQASSGFPRLEPVLHNAKNFTVVGVSRFWDLVWWWWSRTILVGSLSFIPDLSVLVCITTDAIGICCCCQKRRTLNCWWRNSCGRTAMMPSATWTSSV